MAGVRPRASQSPEDREVEIHGVEGLCSDDALAGELPSFDPSPLLQTIDFQHVIPRVEQPVVSHALATKDPALLAPIDRLGTVGENLANPVGCNRDCTSRFVVEHGRRQPVSMPARDVWNDDVGLQAKMEFALGQKDPTARSTAAQVEGASKFAMKFAADTRVGRPRARHHEELTIEHLGDRVFGRIEITAHDVGPKIREAWIVWHVRRRCHARTIPCGGGTIT